MAEMTIPARVHPSFPALEGFDLVGMDVLTRRCEAPIQVVHPDPMFQVTLTPQKPAGRGWHQLTIGFSPDGIVDVVAQIYFADGESFWQRLPALHRNYFVVYIRCNSPLKHIRFLISGSGHLMQPTQFTFGRVNRALFLLRLASRLHHIIKRDGLAAIGTIAQAAFRLTRPGTVIMARGSAAVPQEAPYGTWIRVFDEAPQRDRARHVERQQTLQRHPLFSILVIVQTSDSAALERLTRTLAEQVYPQWELIIAAPGELVDVVTEKLSRQFQNHTLLVTTHQADRAATLNNLASRSSGDFLVSVPTDAVLRSNALLELALTLDAYPEAQVIYSDEDQIGKDGQRQNPSFKPAWSPDVFDVSDYLANLTALRRQAVLAVSGWRSDFAGAADYDLKMRIIDRIAPSTIVHLAKILVHTSAELPPEMLSQKARAPVEDTIRDHCLRRNLNADVVWPEAAAQPRLRYRISGSTPLVSLLIPTRDRANILESCVRSILARTNYQPYEILIIDNDSREPATHQLFSKLRAEPSIRILKHHGPFNFAALNNAAARQAKGSIIGLINNDIEAKDGGWLAEVVTLALRDEVGCVGCKLLYPEFADPARRRSTRSRRPRRSWSSLRCQQFRRIHEPIAHGAERERSHCRMPFYPQGDIRRSRRNGRGRLEDRS